MNGAPYKINLFLDGTRNFGGPDSEGFIASIYNFSGSLESSACGNCQLQKKEGVKCIAQVPATVPMRRFMGRTATAVQTTRETRDDPKPIYLAMDSLGTVSDADPPEIPAAD